MSQPISLSDRQVLTPLDEVLTRLLDSAAVQREREWVDLENALDRVLANDVLSPMDLPLADYSAVDGYAFDHAYADRFNETGLKLVQSINAGQAWQEIEPGSVARIHTGALIPKGADAVVMQEHCERAAGLVSGPKDVQSNLNVRIKGQDIKSGQRLLKTGHKIRPQDMGLLASVGVGRIEVFRTLRVALLFSGDELREPKDGPLRAGQVYNANRYTLLGLLQGLNVEVIDLGVVADSLDHTLSTLQRAVHQADLVITTGGASVGDEDYLKPAIEALGALRSWRLAIKPGKPFGYGQIENKTVFCLPGNPGAVFVTFCMLVRPFLLKLLGYQSFEPEGLDVPVDFEVSGKRHRCEFVAARCGDVAGERRLLVPQKHNSGVMLSCSWGHGLVELPAHKAFKPGDTATFYPFSRLLGLPVEGEGTVTHAEAIRA